MNHNEKIKSENLDFLNKKKNKKNSKQLQLLATKYIEYILLL